MLNVKTSTSPMAALLPSAAVQAPTSASTLEANPTQPSFAKMLKNNQAPAPTAAPVATRQPAQAQTVHADKPGPEPKAHAQTAAEATHSPTPSATRPASPAREPARAAEAHEADASEPSVDGADEPHDQDDSSVATDPALADWLAGLKLPDPSPATTPLPLPTPMPTPLPAPLPAPVACPTANAAATPVESATTTPNDTRNAGAVVDAAASAAVGSAAVIALGSGVAARASASTEPGRDRPAPGARAESGGRAAGRIERSQDNGPRGTVRDGSDLNLSALATASAALGGQAGAGADTGGGSTADRGAQAPVWSALSSAAASSPTASAFMPINQTALALPAGQSASQPLPVNLPAPLSSPEFPQAMGAQLTLLAQNGIEHAELHLNPADMGPVSVQIEVQGTQARIDFGADMATTRQAIEASLPELASALREAGLTLSGGGVSEHSRSRQDMADAQGSGRGNGTGPGTGRGDAGASGETTPAPLRRSVRVGGVDAYA